MEIQEEIHHFIVLGGGRLRGTKIEQTLCEQSGVS